jgi:hypothetical protein
LQLSERMDLRALLAVGCFPLALSLTAADYVKLNAGGVKLSGAEIARMREAIAAAGSSGRPRRRTIARRLRSEAPQALQALRHRLERAPPD